MTLHFWKDIKKLLFSARVDTKYDELSHYTHIIQSMAEIYFAVYYIDIENDTFVELKTKDSIKNVLGESVSAKYALELMADKMVEPEFVKPMREYVDLSTLQERMGDKNYVTIKYRGKTTKWSQGYMIPAGYDSDGKMTHVVYAARTIHREMEATEKHEREIQKARDEAESANAAKTSFLFNMSHDIRTPMNAIMGFTTLLRKNIDNEKTREDYLNKIESSSNVLLSIINNVLEMARIEKGTVELIEKPTDLDSIIHSLHDIIYEQILKKGIELTKEFNVTHNIFIGDETKLREIYMNILSNSYKYTEPGGKIHVQVDELPSEREGYSIYRTTISDTGIGMSEEFLPHLFEEFARENDSKGNNIEGTGLGMSIVKRLVEMMGGTIDVKSKLGEGTTFVVDLPHKIVTEPVNIEHHPKQIDEKLFEGKRILLAEDNDLNAEIAIDILAEVGLTADHVRDGKECCRMLEESSDGYYDLILMDIQMPIMNGYEATETIRGMKNKIKANIPIVAMTANAFAEDKKKAIEVGMNGHLAKPINTSSLFIEIAKVLG